MYLRVLFFFLPLCLGAEELIWKSGSSTEITKEEFDKAIQVYVEKTYPDKIERLKAEHVVLYKGLMWQDNDQAQGLKLRWDNAIEHCKELSFAGHHDWRLPSLEELKTLVGGKCEMPSGFERLDDCGRQKLYGYWSSTVHSSDANFAENIYFQSAFLYNGPKSHAFNVRCVRDGI